MRRFSLFLLLPFLLNQAQAAESRRSWIQKKILKLNPRLQDESELYAYLITQNCDKKVQNDAVFIFAQESTYNTYAKSKTGDYGLGQVNFKVWHNFFDIKNPEELYDPETNIQISCTILKMTYQTRYKKAKDFYWSYYHSWNGLTRNEYIKRILKIKEELNK